MKALMNSATLPGPGVYEYRLIPADEATRWLRAGGWTSYIGYQETASHIAALAGVEVPLSRERTVLHPGDEALVVRLTYRVNNPAAKGLVKPGPDDWEYGVLRRLQ